MDEYIRGLIMCLQCGHGLAAYWRGPIEGNQLRHAHIVTDNYPDMDPLGRPLNARDADERDQEHWDITRLGQADAEVVD